ncbi:MAG: SDR family oxidoreductase [Nocardioidaceae bacterium]
MQVAVLGGAGTAGAHAVAALRAQGHDVRVVTRSTGADAYRGVGLDEALHGVDVVVDTTNTASLRRTTAEDFFVTAAGRVQTAAQAAGVQHLVLLSILGLDRVRGYGYYSAKLAQERASTAGPVPVTVLRASQFHEFPAQLLTRLRWGPLAAVPTMQVQPVAAATVGSHLARLATDRPGGVVELAGPQVHDLADLARRFVATRQERLRVVGLRLPGKAARDMRGGALLATASTVVDGPTYDEWLGTADAQRLALRA